MRPPDWNATPRPRPPTTDSQMTHAELVRELRRLRVLVNEMSEKLRAAGGVVSHIDLAIDRNGKRYTTHCFADWGDPWHGATILLPGTVSSLRNQGLLPLMIVWPPPERREES